MYMNIYLWYMYIYFVIMYTKQISQCVWNMIYFYAITATLLWPYFLDVWNIKFRRHLGPVSNLGFLFFNDLHTPHPPLTPKVANALKCLQKTIFLFLYTFSSKKIESFWDLGILRTWARNINQCLARKRCVQHLLSERLRLSA